MKEIKEVINTIYQELHSPEKLRRKNLIEMWPSITGPKVSFHTKPVLGRGGQLIVWVDQSALAFELKQRYSNALLKRVQAVLGEECVKSIRFYVGQIR